MRFDKQMEVRMPNTLLREIQSAADEQGMTGSSLVRAVMKQWTRERTVWKGLMKQEGSHAA
jgi:hypothetical protein